MKILLIFLCAFNITDGCSYQFYLYNTSCQYGNPLTLNAFSKMLPTIPFKYETYTFSMKAENNITLIAHLTPEAYRVYDVIIRLVPESGTIRYLPTHVVCFNKTCPRYLTFKFMLLLPCILVIVLVAFYYTQTNGRLQNII